MRLIHSIPLLSLFSIFFFGCHQEKTGYFEVKTSVPGFRYTYLGTYDPYHPMSHLDTDQDYIKVNFAKKRKTFNYHFEAISTADSGVYVEVSIKAYVEGELINEEKASGYNGNGLYVRTSVGVNQVTSRACIYYKK